MTRKTLARNVALAMLFFVAILIAAIVARLLSEGVVGGCGTCVRTGSAVYATIKDVLPLLIALPAAWLAFCFNRRNSFLQTLDALWRLMVDAKGKCFAYSFDPTDAAYTQAWLALSGAIDSMRSVYRNVHESREKLGLFPFEPLHDMRKRLHLLRAALAAESDAHRRAKLQAAARKDLTAEWNGLRCKFLLEFGAPAPSDPITRRNFRDPRRRDDADDVEETLAPRASGSAV